MTPNLLLIIVAYVIGFLVGYDIGKKQLRKEGKE